MKPPEVPTKGPKAWRKVANEMVDYVEAIKPVAGNNISVRELPGGRQITGTPGGASLGGSTTTYFIRNGVLVSYEIPFQSGPVTIE